MIYREFPNIMVAYRGLVDELAYSKKIKPLRWGVCLGYPDVLNINIADVVDSGGLHLGAASYTKSRWTRFLRRYFREDLAAWLKEAMEKLNKYPSRPFVCSYSLNLDTGHNYGGCLSSLQIRISPQPTVILYSRACHIDKVGFLDLCLINIIAREMGLPNISGRWIITSGFISAISQIYYVKRFKMPTINHRLEKTMKRLTDVAYEDIKFGPLKRGRKRMEALDQFGEIPRSVPVANLSIGTEVFS